MDRYINIIAAVGTKGLMGIEANGKQDLPWRIPEDMENLVSNTMGHVLIMGRGTWESIPEKFREFPGRDLYVISRDKKYDTGSDKTVLVSSLENAVALAHAEHPEKTLWIFGGMGVYKQVLEGDAFLPLIKDVLITRVAEDTLPERSAGAKELRTDLFDDLYQYGFEPETDSPELQTSKKGPQFWFETWSRS